MWRRGIAIVVVDDRRSPLLILTSPCPRRGRRNFIEPGEVQRRRRRDVCLVLSLRETSP